MQITLEYNNSVNKGLQSVLYAPRHEQGRRQPLVFAKLV